MRRFFSTALAFASAPFFTGCADYAFAEQDLAVRYSESAKTIHIDLETRGLYPTDRRWGESEADAAGRALDRAVQVASGRRYLQVFDWPLIFDLDAALEDAAAAGVQGASPEQRFHRALLEALDPLVTVEATSLVDDLGEAGLRQRFTVSNAPEALRAVNQIISQAVREELDSTQARSASDAENPINEPYESEVSRDNLRSFLDAGEPWITIDEEWLSVRAPLTPEDLALLARGFASDLDVAEENSESLARSASFLRALLDQVGEIRIDDDIVSLRWSAGRGGAVRMSYRGERDPGAARFGAALTARLKAMTESTSEDKIPVQAGKR